MSTSIDSKESPMWDSQPMVDDIPTPIEEVGLVSEKETPLATYYKDEVTPNEEDFVIPLREVVEENVRDDVPQYEHRFSKAVLRPFLEALGSFGLTQFDFQAVVTSVMLDKGYPNFWIRSIVSSVRKETDDVGARFDFKRIGQIEEITARSNKNNAKIIRHTGKAQRALTVKSDTSGVTSKRSAEHWRVPWKRLDAQFARPTADSFSYKTFRGWANSICTALSHRIKRKTQFITGNSAAEALWYMTAFQGRRKDLKVILDAAHFFISEYTDEPVIRRALRDLQGGIVFRGRFIDSEEKFSKIKMYLTRDKPLLRNLEEYFACKASGPDVRGFDLVRLQRILDAKYNLESENVTLAETYHVPLDKTPLSPKGKHYLRAVAKPWFPKGGGVGLIPDDVPFMDRIVQAGLGKVTGTYQGLVGSKPVQVEHIVAPTSISSISNVLGEVVSVTAKSYIRPVIQVVSFLSSFFQCTSWQQMLSCLVQFASGNDLAWSYCVDRVDYITSARFQGEGDGVFTSLTKDVSSFLAKGFGMIWEALAGAGLFTLVNLCMADMSHMLFEPLKDLITSVRISMARAAGKTVADSILEGIKEIFARLRRCWESKSLTPIWGEQWDPVRWDGYATTYMEFYQTLTVCQSYSQSAYIAIQNLVKTGKLPDFWNEPVYLEMFIQRADELRVQGERLAVYYKSDRLACDALVKKAYKLGEFVNPLRSKVDGLGIRIQPFFILFAGKAGGGKTTLSRELWQATKRRYAYSNNGVYDWRANVNFQTNLDHTSWGVDMDDIDTTVAPPAAGTPNHIECVLDLINNKPMPVEESESHLKGKTIAAPLLVMYKTNFENARVNHFLVKPAPFWRRINLHVTLSAKDEFGTNGVLDAASAEMSQTWDMFNIDVRYYDPRVDVDTNTTAIPLTAPIRVSFTQFVDLFYQEYELHMGRQRKLISAYTYGGTVCPVCKFPLTRSCGHNAVVESGYQGAVLSSMRATGEALISNAAWTARGLGAVLISPAFDWATGQVLHSAAQRLCGGNFWLGTASCLAIAGTISYLIDKTVTVTQGRIGNAVNGLIPTNWLRAEQDYIPGIPPVHFASTFTFDDLVSSLRNSFIRVTGPKDSGHGWIVAHNSILFPSHYAPSEGDVISVTYQGKTITCQLTPFTSRRCANTELTFVKIGSIVGRGGLTSFMWESVDNQVVSFDELKLVYPDEIKTQRVSKLVRSGLCYNVATDGVTKNGDCGIAYVARMGSSWRIVAMHYMISERTTLFGMDSTSLGAVISSMELAKLATSLATDLQGVRTEPLLMSKKPENVSLTRFPYKSEVWAAMSFHGATPYCFGTLNPPMSGSTLKTRLSYSLIKDDCSAIIERWTGNKDYWKMPIFKGKMVEDKWVSPFTVAFKTENRKTFHHPTMWMALIDYLFRVDRLDTSGYAELSEEQVFTGISGSYVNRINTKTSVGPPFNCSKQMHVAITPEGAYMSPEVWSIFDGLANTLRLFIPAAVGLCTLKDEALKEGKTPRVFVVFSFAYNMLLKKKGAPWKSFMRANLEFFESCVGVNMTGQDCHHLVEGLRSVNPGLDNIYCYDSEKLDKSYSGEIYDFVALCIFAMCFVIGVDSRGNYHLAHGLKHTRFSIKNDLFSAFWNGSGNDWTVELNGIVMSLSERYIYYRGGNIPEEHILRYMEHFFENPIPGEEFLDFCKFRKTHTLRTYGDDELMSTHEPVRGDYFVICRNELGINKTNADKSDVDYPIPVDIRHGSFLKRTFFWHEDSRRWVGQLSLKSMARMLSIKKESQLSFPDNAAVSITECLREAVYYGREFYDALLSEFQPIIEKRMLAFNSYLRTPSYDFYLKQILDGTFQTWVDRDELLQNSYTCVEDPIFDYENVTTED